VWEPSFQSVVRADGSRACGVGHPLVDEFLDFVAGRARPNTVVAYAYDLVVFFGLVGKEPAEVTTRDVLAFIAAQQRPRDGDGNVVRLSDGRAGLSTATIRRRLAAVSSLYGYLVARGDVGVETNPVPRGLPTRSPNRKRSGVPLVRSPRRLPRVLDAGQVDALLGALRTARDLAMVQAMLLGGLRRCEVLGLVLDDLRVEESRVFVRDGKGGHQRIVPMSRTFFESVAAYVALERPGDAETDAVFLVLKGPRRGQPLTAAGLDQILASARERAGLDHASCHELRHTCLTRLKEAGMPIEALQAQAGHRSISSTLVYLHLGPDWLAGEYRRAAEAIEGQAYSGTAR
jgi:site-specific recombinase XerD